jgi:rubrerythrin
MSVGYLKKCSSYGRPKDQFLTQSEAEGRRASLIHQGKWTWGNSNTYWCNQCGFYHAGKLGRANRGKGRKVAAKNRPRHLDCQ